METKDEDFFYDESVASMLSDFKNNLPDLAKEKLTLAVPKSETVTKTFEELLENFNKKHNLHLQVNFNDLFSNLSKLQEGNNLRLVELYLSDVWNTFRVAFFIRILQSLFILSDKLASPERLMDVTTTAEQDFALIDKLFDFINRISILGRDIGIFDVDSELTRIHRMEQSKQNELSSDNAKVLQILQALGKSLGYGTENKSE